MKGRYKLKVKASLAALLALSAIAAFGAQAASASHFETSGSEIKGLTITPNEQRWSNPNVNAFCSGSFTYANKLTQFDQFTSDNLSASVCQAGTMTTNGCKLTFRPQTEISSGHFAGKVDIGPTNCGPIVYKWTFPCVTSFYSKTDMGAEFVNVGSGASRAIQVTVKGQNLHSSGNCGSEGDNTTYEGYWELKGYTSGAQRGLYIEKDGGAGISVSSGSFNAAKAPRPVTATQTSPLALTTIEGTATCQGSLSGTLQSISVSSLALEPAFTSCTAFGLTAKFTKNSCRFAYSVSVGGAPYKGNASIACDKEGDGMVLEPEIFGGTICVMTLPAQTIGSVEYENVGTAGSEKAHVIAKLKGSKIKYTGTGGVCGNGAKEDATSSSTLDLVGTY
jgi:hypothetical protein